MTVTDDIYGTNQASERPDLPPNPFDVFKWSSTTKTGTERFIGKRLRGVVVFYDEVPQTDTETKQIKYQPEFFENGQPNPRWKDKDGKPVPKTQDVYYVLAKDAESGEMKIFREYLSGNHRYDVNAAKEKAGIGTFKKPIGMGYDRLFKDVEKTPSGGTRHIFEVTCTPPLQSGDDNFETIKKMVIDAYRTVKTHNEMIAELLAANPKNGDLSHLAGSDQGDPGDTVARNNPF